VAGRRNWLVHPTMDPFCSRLQCPLMPLSFARDVSASVPRLNLESRILESAGL
jgi:hypothetical protein